MSWSCDVTPADCSPVFGYKVSQSLQSYSAGLFSSAETSANRTFTSDQQTYYTAIAPLHVVSLLSLLEGLLIHALTTLIEIHSFQAKPRLTAALAHRFLIKLNYTNFGQ